MMNEIEQLKKIFYDHKFQSTVVKSRLKDNSQLIKFIENEFSKNNEKYDSFICTLKCLVLDFKFKKCIICGKELSYKNSKKKNSKFCSNDCKLSKDGNPFTWLTTKNKIKETNLKKYGTEYASQSQEIKDKIKQTCLEKFGVNYLAQSSEIRQRINETCQQRYGSNSPLADEKIKNKAKKTCLKRYGFAYALQNEDVKQQIRKTCLNKYGKETNLHIDKVVQKAKQSIKEKYGVQFPFQNNQIREKIKKTCLEKFGVTNPIENKKIRQKIQQTNIEKFGTKTPFESKIFRDQVLADVLAKESYERLSRYSKYIKPNFSLEDWKKNRKENKDYEFSWICVNCGEEFKQRVYTTSFLSDMRSCPRCWKCYPQVSGYSNIEKELLSFLREIYEGEILENDKKLIKPYELDLVLSKIKLAIEFNGMYFHSIEHGYELGYHLMKTEMCESIGYRLIHIWEKDWIKTKEEVKNRLKRVILQKDNELILNQPLDRCWYQLKNTDKYEIEIIKPEIEKYKNIHFENCGYLIYKEKNYGENEK
jgi:very-short-patch-repair endonuclease